MEIWYRFCCLQVSSYREHANLKHCHAPFNPPLSSWTYPSLTTPPSTPPSQILPAKSSIAQKLLSNGTDVSLASIKSSQTSIRRIWKIASRRWPGSSGEALNPVFLATRAGSAWQRTFLGIMAFPGGLYHSSISDLDWLGSKDDDVLSPPMGSIINGSLEHTLPP